MDVEVFCLECRTRCLAGSGRSFTDRPQELGPQLAHFNGRTGNRARRDTVQDPFDVSFGEDD
jgi:hypothetical protein